MAKMNYRNTKTRAGSLCVERDAYGVKRDTQYAIRNTTYDKKALTLLEMVIAMAIMVIVFAALLPQFRAILNSWDSKAAAAETLQNARVLIDHINRNLTEAARITAVSDFTETVGFIEFEDNEGEGLRYDVDANDYVQFGLIGSLSELAGPVSQLQFTCYDGNDFVNPITDANDIRFVKAEATLTNPAAMGRDITFTAQTYLRVGSDILCTLGKGAPFEFDILKGKESALTQIDSTHYLCAYQGDRDTGWAVVLTVDTESWEITKETPYEFDTVKGKTSALAQIDATHYLCAYAGDGDDGWATVLTVNTGTWEITKETPFEFDDVKGKTPALAQIDATHYLCAYAGDGDDGWATVLTVNTGTWEITKETPYEFDTVKGKIPALEQIDATHYLCAYGGDGDDGWATVLTVNTGTWEVTNETPYEHDGDKGKTPALAQIDATHYLCAYAGDGDDGWATVLTVYTATWEITEEMAIEYDSDNGKTPALVVVDPNNYLCAYAGESDDGWSVILQIPDCNAAEVQP